MITSLLPGLSIERGERRHYEEAQEKGHQPLRELNPAGYRNWVDFLRDEFGRESRMGAFDKIRQGEAVHFVLAQIKDTADSLEEALAAARAAFAGEWNEKEAAHLVHRVLEDADCGKFFRASGAEVFVEKEVVDSRGNAKRIDRLIVFPAEAWVVDFKSSREGAEEHRAQIAEYVRIIRQVYPGRSVRGFLVYLDDTTVVEVDG